LKLCHPVGSELVKISTLKEHPRHQELFDDDPDLIDVLAEAIASEGLEYPPIVNDDNVIISGHVRIWALKKLGANYVYVRRKHYESEADEVNAMINIALFDNRYIPHSYLSRYIEIIGRDRADEMPAGLKYLRKQLLR
jgi:ParB-like chromosome segregation protein Spo0J